MENAVFNFVSSVLPKDTFEVLRFSGEEGLSRLYSFDLLLLSDREDIDAGAVLQGTGTFTISYPFAPEGGLDYEGILASFTCLHRMSGRYVYRVELRHKLWWLSLVRQNRVFLDCSPQDACTDILREAGLDSGSDFVWKCQSVPIKREFVCQYDETDLSFLSRWLERLGIYYWFEHGNGCARCVFGDTASLHLPLPGNDVCDFVEPSGLNPENPGRVIVEFWEERKPLPREVLCKTYDPQKPDLDLSVAVPVDRGGRGVFYRYGETYSSLEEGRALATVEADALRCRARLYRGTSHNPALRPGHTFTLRRHFRSGWNRQYLTTGVRHEGSQARLLVRAFGLSGLSDADRLYYRNSFTAIPADAQFRAARETPWPQVAGCIPARVDGQGSGEFAELDEQGRYKIILPFDVSGRGNGKASCWLRMIQPYAGEGMGFHAPLHKGTEVMISFVGGDPDQPIIAGAVPNPTTPSPVTDVNATQIALNSAAGLRFQIEDAPGLEHIMLASPDRQSFIKLERAKE